MMERISAEWMPERLNELRKQTGMTLDTMSLGSGVTVSALNSYSQGKSVPSLQSLVRLADFFAVPVDYLLGRMDEDDLSKNYAEYFMKLRRAPYEQYLASGRNELPSAYLSSKIEAPWPYNLLDDIADPRGDSRWEYALNPDQMDGLYVAMTSLTEREETMVRAYYERGLTLENVATEYDLTRERVRQIVSKAVRKLRHPARRRLIELGVEGVAEEKRYSQREQELKEKLHEVEQLEAAVKAKMSELGTMMALLPDGKVDYTPRLPMDAQIDELDLSVRSWNCLRRADINTIRDACEAARAGRLVKLRNLGRKSLDEIVTKLELFTGEDFRNLYGGIL